jgi:hypothetical protein
MTPPRPVAGLGKIGIRDSLGICLLSGRGAWPACADRNVRIEEPRPAVPRPGM